MCNFYYLIPFLIINVKNSTITDDKGKILFYMFYTHYTKGIIKVRECP